MNLTSSVKKIRIPEFYIHTNIRRVYIRLLIQVREIEMNIR